MSINSTGWHCPVFWLLGSTVFLGCQGSDRSWTASLHASPLAVWIMAPLCPLAYWNISSELQEPCLPLPFFCQQLFLVSGMAGLDLPWFLSLQPNRFLFSFLLSSFPSGSAKVSKPRLSGMQLDCVVSFLSPASLHTFSDSSLSFGVCWYLSPKLPNFKRRSYL